MAKRKTASTRKTAKPKAKARGAKKPTRKAAASKPVKRAKRARAARATPKKRVARPVARKRTPTRSKARKVGAGKGRAGPPGRPAQGLRDASSVPFVIVDEPEDEMLEHGATSTLDLEHRPRLPIALAELEDDRTGTARGDATLKAGDADADSERAYFTGDETPGGDNPTPGQDVVDDIGRSLGVEYDDDEELQGAEKIAERDRHRWELNPASAESTRPRRR